MKLNPDCIRDILLSVEENSTFDKPLIYDYENQTIERFQKYYHEELIYHIRQCEYSDFLIDVSILYDGKFVSIADLSPSGHEFIANIRNDTFFEKVKHISKEIGVHSLEDLTSIALNCAALLIKAHFNIP